MILRINFLCLIIAFFLSCTSEKYESDDIQHDQNISAISEYFDVSEHDIDILQDAYRFGVDRVIPFEMIHIYKEDLARLKEKIDKTTEKIVRRKNIVPDLPWKTEIFYKIKTSQLTDPFEILKFTDLTQWTMAYVNSKKIGLRFTETSSSSGANIIIKAGSVLGSQGCGGAASPPTTTSVGSRITLEPSLLNESSNYFIAVLLHEVGHTLGLAHPNETQYQVIPGTTISSESIMERFNTGCNIGDHKTRFTNIDIIALKYLHGR